MRQLHCPACHENIFFEQTCCSRCGASLTFDASGMIFCCDDALACANRSLIRCNWAAKKSDELCSSCSLTRTIPTLDSPRNVLLWRRVEEAKRRLLYDLARLELPLSGCGHGRQIAFDILADNVGQPVMTGHLNGLITMNLSEADDVEREVRRTRFREPYRTLLGHFRHEVGHFFWELLVSGTKLQQPFRVVFGDETTNYQEAIHGYHSRMDRVYDRAAFISEYATSHPWEDWAETFAHFLHIVSTLDSASSLPLALAQRSHETLEDPYMEKDFEALLSAWMPVSYTMNELNRSMGLSDAYPFELTLAVRGKLHFVHMAILSFRTHAQPKLNATRQASVPQS
jgi:hypothetical protein